MWFMYVPLIFLCMVSISVLSFTFSLLWYGNIKYMIPEINNLWVFYNFYDNVLL